MRLFSAILVSVVAAHSAFAQNELTLPVGQNLRPRAVQSTDVTLDINSAGSYALNGRSVAASVLGEQLRPLMRGSRDRVLYVRADARLHSSRIDSASAIAARTGVCVVALIATQRPGTLSGIIHDSAAYDAPARRAIDVQLPIVRAPAATIARQRASAIVIEVLPGPTYRINAQAVTQDNLTRRLREIFDPRPIKLLYVRADPAVAYQDVFHAMDIAREAGVVDIVAAPPELAIRDRLPDIDLTLRVTARDDAAAERIDGNIGRCRRGDVYAGGPAASGAATSADRVYFEFQVEKPAKALPDSAPPRYPEAMRASRTNGEVLAQFVVDTNGTVLPETFKVLKTTHDLFTQAVRVALPGMRFTPATIAGVPVRQIVQRPFYFTTTP